MSETPPDGLAMAEAVRAGETTPVQLVEAAIERIERLNPQLNFLVTDRFEQALTEAASHDGSGAFAGVPFLTKDLGSETAGEPHWMGNRALRRIDNRATTTSYLADLFRDAGFINLGRANTPEFGSIITTEPLANGPCRNPWNTDHSTGGSSGGSAAAVAAGIVPVAHANDGGGSIRIPASECGLVGLKPSRARVSSGPLAGQGWGGATADLVVSRSVRDTAAVLDAVGVAMPGDPYIAPPPQQPFLDEVGTDPGTLRVHVFSQTSDGGIDPACVEAAESTGRILESLGHQVTTGPIAALEDESSMEALISLIAVDVARDVAKVATAIGKEPTEDDIEIGNLLLAELGRTVTGLQVIEAIDAAHAYGRMIAGVWADGGFDVLVTPTLGGPPPPIGWLTGPESTDRMAPLLRFTAQFNVTGQPGISLPMHWSDGLPIGVQLVAAQNEEALLIQLASQLEAAAPWAHRLPPTNAF